MISKITYTRINLIYLLIFTLTKNNYMRVFCINSSLAVLLSFESLYLFDCKVMSIIKKENEHLYLCKYNKNFFYFYDYLVHIAPLIYLSYNNVYLSISNIKLIHLYLISISSCFLHLFWGYIVSNGTYKLEHIYIPGSLYKLKDNIWNNLWEITIFSHFLLPNLIASNKMYDYIFLRRYS